MCSFRSVILLLASTASAFPYVAEPLPAKRSLQNANSISSSKILNISACGPVGQYFYPKFDDWHKANTDKFLHNWIDDHREEVKKHGFAQTFGEWAAGLSSFTCRDDGSEGCNTDSVCGNERINALGDDIAPAFYVLKATENLHAYYRAASEAYETSGLLGALETDIWTKSFFKKPNGKDADDNDIKDLVILKEILFTVGIIVNIGTIFTAGCLSAATVPFWQGGPALAVPIAAFGGAVANSGALLVIEAAGATNNAIRPKGGVSNFLNAAQIGHQMAAVIKSTLEDLITQNNDLMAFKTNKYSGKTIEDHLTGGYFVNSTTDKVAAVDAMGAMLEAMSVNTMWRAQKVFIMGGVPCGDNLGLGTGPRDYSWCDSKGRRWYIYWWQERENIWQLGRHKWGKVNPPPGVEQMGEGGMFPRLSVQDVIKSSVASYEVAGYNYDAQLHYNRTMDALKNGILDPAIDGPAGEGVFTIPVCDISRLAREPVRQKDKTLVEYGEKPIWCRSAICSGSQSKTDEFLKAAHLFKFEGTHPFWRCGAQYRLPFWKND